MNDEDLEFEYDLAVLVLGHNLVAGKWTLSILWYLSKGNMGFSELYEFFKYTSKSVFSKQLHELQDAGLVKRKVLGKAPIRVEYSLTEIGAKLIPVFNSMIEWSTIYVKTQKDEEMSDIDFIEQSFLTDKYKAYKDAKVVLTNKKSNK
jgi:DNA-binding HxlR family transcriptional regulator